jgi:hypothetical protein
VNNLISITQDTKRQRQEQWRQLHRRCDSLADEVITLQDSAKSSMELGQEAMSRIIEPQEGMKDILIQQIVDAKRGIFWYVSTLFHHTPSSDRFY